MFIEIVLGILIAIVLLYLWLLYLQWSDTYNGLYNTYKIIPASVSNSDKAILDKWNWALPPEVLSDTYKYINFWLLYNYNLVTLKI